MSRSVRTGLTSEEIKRDFQENLRCGLGRLERAATRHDLYYALALTVRDRVFQRTVESMENYGGANARRVAYLSAEYLPGPHLANSLLNLGITGATREALQSLDIDLDEIIAQEEEPGLGNGGLGRLASCFMDSLASVDRAALYRGHFFTLRRLHRRMDHEPERTGDQIPCHRATCYVRPRDHVVGTLSTLVSCSVSHVSPSVHPAWLVALSPPKETRP
jgi:Carbohydrate phosphorylase